MNDTIKLEIIQCCCIGGLECDNPINWGKHRKYLFQANFDPISKHTQITDVTLTVKSKKISS